MKRRTTRNTFRSKNGKKLYAVNPGIARFLENLSLSGSSVLQEDLTVTNGIGSAVQDIVYPAGTNIESIVRDILTLDQPAVTQIQSLVVEDSNGDSLRVQALDGNGLYEVGTEVTLHQIDYLVVDEDANLVPNSGRLVTTLNNTSEEVLSGLAVENNVSYNNVVLGTPKTIGGFTSDFPVNETLAEPHITTIRLNATTADDEQKTKATTIEHAYPAFMLILAKTTSTFTKDAPVNVGNDQEVANLFNLWQSQNSFFEPLATALEPSNVHPKKVISTTDSFSNHQWQVPQGANDDALPAQSDLGGILGETPVWDYFFFFPMAHPDVSKPNVTVETASGVAYNSSFIITDAVVNIDLSLLATQVDVAYAPSSQTYPYRLIELKDYNALNNEANQESPTQPIIFKFTD